jgi:serine/threonine protein kinase
LINGQKQVKIADFGLARSFNFPSGKLTRDIATLWYRAPELLLGDDYYSITIDIWAVGCIMAEMIRKKPLI